jgi:hypothetical protein
VLKKIVRACLPFGLLRLYGNIKKSKRYKKTNIKPLEKRPHNSPQFIVTLTSYGKRVNKKAPYAIRSLLNQSIQPDRIVLYLAHGTTIPTELEKLRSAGLEIRFCDDLRSYKKLIPALSEFSNDILVTADDDIYYPSDWFKLLKESYLQNTSKIHCHRAHEICLDEDKNIIPYLQWRQEVKSIEYSKRIFPTGCGGVLYPPHSLADEVFNRSVFQSLCPYADDVWFWAMARLKGTGYALVKGCIPETVDIGINDDGLMKINVTENKNDEQIQNIIKMYPEVYKSII